MRIIGGKDYYDHGLSFGIDQSVLLIRKPFSFYTDLIRGHILNFLPKMTLSNKSTDNGSRVRFLSDNAKWTFDDIEYEASAVSIFFCGKIYKGIRVIWYSKTPFRNMSATGGSPTKISCYNGRRETFWDLNSFNKWGSKRGITIGNNRTSFGKVIGNVFSKTTLSSTELTPYLENNVTVATWYRGQKKTEDKETSLFKRDSVEYWECNSDKLKEFDFIKIMSPTEAFQQISMWVGGVLPRPGNKIVEIQDDAIKLAKHGMDKFSFRKLPSKV